MNMRQSLQLSIPAACRQSWSGMQKLKDGRYCSACQKTVIDFTAMTDAELIKHFQQSATPTCGRFTAEQLNRNLLLPRKPLPFLKYLVFVSLPAFLLSFKTGAQVQPVATETSPVTFKKQKEKRVGSIKLINGLVYNGVGVAQPGVQVSVAGTNEQTVTNAKGEFGLESVLPTDTIVFHHIDHYELQLPATRFEKDGLVQMSAIQAMLGGPVVEFKPKPRNKTEKKKWFRQK